MTDNERLIVHSSVRSAPGSPGANDVGDDRELFAKSLQRMTEVPPAQAAGGSR